MRLLGITDCVNECDCCGKTDLKCTVAFLTTDLQIVYYGRTCATKHYQQPTKVINSELRTIADTARSEARNEYRTHPAVKELSDVVSRLNNGPRIDFNERVQIIQPYSDAERIARKDIEEKYCKKYMLKSICVY